MFAVPSKGWGGMGWALRVPAARASQVCRSIRARQGKAWTGCSSEEEVQPASTILYSLCQSLFPRRSDCINLAAYTRRVALAPVPPQKVYENRVYDLLQSARLGKRQAQHLPIQVLGANCCVPGLLRVSERARGCGCVRVWVCEAAIGASAAGVWRHVLPAHCQSARILAPSVAVWRLPLTLVLLHPMPTWSPAVPLSRRAVPLHGRGCRPAPVRRGLAHSHAVRHAHQQRVQPLTRCVHGGWAGGREGCLREGCQENRSNRGHKGCSAFCGSCCV